jgi:two-component system sensor histidine kinase TctE
MAQQANEQRSLFGEILDWMLAPLLLLWPMSVAITWLVAQGIANHPYDRELGQMARTLARHVSVDVAAAQPQRAKLKLDALASDLMRADDADQIWFQVLGLRGELIGGDRDLPTPPDEERTFPGELHFRDDQVNSEPVRVAYLWLPGQPLARGQTPPLVQVAETLDKRSRLATEIIKGVILPQFVILPLAVLLVWLALARGIKPLNELQRRIRSRDSHDLSPIGEREAPEEVAPLVLAINDLLARLDQSISRQKHFLADAAHQLKTPLAGLRTQAELAQREIDTGRSSPEELKRSLQQIARSSQRAAHMVNQLLAMARAEDQEHAARQQEVNLARLATETVRDFVPRALERRIDLGYEGPQPSDKGLSLLGQPLLVRELVRNLVDNALQYTPSGGTVTVRVMEDPFGQVVVLQVEDNGPGIAPEEREEVFRPFYRVLGSNVDGSGLGLAIVREIAQQHGAEVSIEDTQPRGGDGRAPGARFTVRFPVARVVTEAR